MWLKKDDGFAGHRKIRRLSDGAYRLHDGGMLACAKDETDGRLTPDDVDEIPNARRLRRFVSELEDVGLWEPQGDGSWLIHDYLDYNPSHAELEAKREATRKRKEKWKAERTRNGVPDAVPDDVPDGVRNTSPSRPVPSRPKKEFSDENSSRAAGASSEPDGFADFWAAWPRRDDKGHAIKAFRAALRKTDAATLAKAAAAFAEQCARERRERRFIPLASTWLAGERWTDEAPGPAAPASNNPLAGVEPWLLRG